MGYERFAPVERVIEIRGDRYTFWQPPDLDALIDVEAFERDERIPYWANVWESALVLAEEVAALEPGGRSLLELGCGLALPAIVACRRGFQAVASDYEDDALEGVRYNADRNGAGRLATLLLDWRRLPDAFPPSISWSPPTCSTRSTTRRRWRPWWHGRSPPAARPSWPTRAAPGP